MAVWREIGSVEVNFSAADFLSGVDVWVRRPQVVNRRLVGAVILKGEDSYLNKDETEVANVAEAQFKVAEKKIENCILIRELLPRTKSIESRREAVTIKHDHVGVSVTFDPINNDSEISRGCGSYMFQYLIEDHIRITLSIFYCQNVSSTDSKNGTNYDFTPIKAHQTTINGKPIEITTSSQPDGVITPTSEWLQTVLLPKIVQWAEKSGQGMVAMATKRQPLVMLDKYCSLYSDLREKYSPSLIQNWPEATDPHKFVYEDIAITTYLILLWEKEREEMGLTKKQTFIDLGCGNGLLVYLLTSEGYSGKGIDIRRRKIWSYYGNGADLEVCSLIPSDSTVFPEYDWLIGNHSDELTPWIPLMAARSSYDTRYFVLPCCPHDFNSKFRRPDTSKSQYASYLDYVRLIGETVGFKVQEDTLRIPSSKRIYQVGCKRWYLDHDENLMEEKRKSFLQERCQNSRAVGAVSGKRGRNGSESTETDDCVEKKEHGNWSDQFVPRSSLEQTRNCSRVDRDLQQYIIHTLTDELLKTENFIEISSAENNDCSEDEGSSYFSSSTSPKSHLTASDKSPKSHLTTSNTSPKSHLTTSGTSPKSHITCLSRNSPSNTSSITHPSHNHDDHATITTHQQDDVETSQDTSCLATENDFIITVSSALNHKRIPVTVHWNLGGKMKLSEAVQLFDSGILRQLKQECGGLQTLLRNHHQIFQVTGGFVQLRNWVDVSSKHGPRKSAKPRSAQDAKRLAKTKLCWFYHHHPQGCPRRRRDCPYAHKRDELKDRPDFSVVAMATHL